MSAAEVAFWVCVAAIVYAQAGYAVVLLVLAAVARHRPSRPDGAYEPVVSLVIAAYREQEVIAAKVADALALDYPRERLELIVACDGSPDETAARARTAGADVVLELPRAGKVAAQDAAVERARGELLAFSDANARWEPGALRALAAAFAEPQVGYACGRLALAATGGANQEGLYWRYELALRALESRLESVTSGNGAIYAVRRDAYARLGPGMSHDLAFPATLVKRGWRAVYVPEAVASEKAPPRIADEFARKRRMASRAWDITLRGGLLSPRGYRPRYALMVYSHRALRYATPFLHVAALALNAALLGRGWLYSATLAAQLGLLAAAAIAGAVRWRPLQVARYYVATTAALAAGLWDWLRAGPPPAWEPVEGTR